MAQNSERLESDKVATGLPAEIVALDPRGRNQAHNQDKYLRILQLSDLLSRHLDVEQIVDTFMGEIAACVDYCGYRFDNEEEEIAVSVGYADAYVATYRLRLPHRLLGELTLYKRGSFTSQELCLLEDLLCSLLYPVRNALMFRVALRSAYRDPLTGLNNRTAMEEEISREIDRSKRHQQSLALLVMDLDGFKNINDGYGHDIGDEVLRKVAAIIGHVLRNTDLLFRYGGDEFVAGLAQTDMRGALDVCERIRASVDSLDLSSLGVATRIRISIGLSLVRDGDKFASLFKRADKALYEAKLKGKNQVIIC